MSTVLPIPEGFSLFCGLSIVIDDHVNDTDQETTNSQGIQVGESDGIVKVIKALEEVNLPFLKMEKLPEQDIIPHLGSINFILLDWELNGTNISSVPELTMGSTLSSDSNDDICKFISNVVSKTYCPIFIFSHLPPETIISQLQQHDLGHVVNNRVLLAKKSSVDTKEKLRTKINQWTMENPSFICLKAWENTFNKAKADTFIDLSKVEKDWPRIFWRAFKEDKVHQWPALAEIISRNVLGRADYEAYYIDLNDLITVNTPIDVTRETVASIVARTECTSVKQKSHPQFTPGDVFQDEESHELWVNIRPVCDTARTNDLDPYLFLLKAEEIEEGEVNNGDWNHDGVIIHPESKIHHIPYIPLNDGARFIRIKFDELKIDKPSKFKSVTRILAPRATELAQRFGLYISQSDSFGGKDIGTIVKIDDKYFVNVRPFYEGDEASKEMHLLSIKKCDISNNIPIIQKKVGIHIIPSLNLEGDNCECEVIFKHMSTSVRSGANVIGQIDKMFIPELLLRYGSYISRTGVMRIPAHSKPKIVASLVSEGGTD